MVDSCQGENSFPVPCFKGSHMQYLVDPPPCHNISAQEYGYCEKVHDFLHSLFDVRCGKVRCSSTQAALAEDFLRMLTTSSSDTWVKS